MSSIVNNLQNDLDYKMVVEQIMRGGEETQSRNAKVMRSFYPFTLRFDSAPIIGWRKINHHLGIREMEAFTNSAVSVEEFDPSIQKWWKPFADGTGDLGWSYGIYYGALEYIIDGLSKAPFSRRHVLSCWDTHDALEQEVNGQLTNCHSTVCQFFVSNNKTLHYKTYQRSADVMLGLPYNLIQHWALLEYVAHATGYKVGSMSYMLGDAHIYESHWDAARELINSKAPDNDAELIYNPSGDEFKAKDFEIKGNIESPIKTTLKMEV